MGKRECAECGAKSTNVYPTLTDPTRVVCGCKADCDERKAAR